MVRAGKSSARAKHGPGSCSRPTRAWPQAALCRGWVGGSAEGPGPGPPVGSWTSRGPSGDLQPSAGRPRPLGTAPAGGPDDLHPVGWPTSNGPAGGHPQPFLACERIRCAGWSITPVPLVRVVGIPSSASSPAAVSDSVSQTRNLFGGRDKSWVVAEEKDN